MDVKQLREFRTKMYTDLYSGIIPERFPVHDGVSTEFMIMYAEKDLMTTQYSYNAGALIEIMEKSMEFRRGDNFGSAFARNPIAAMFQKSKSNVMSKSGFIQHPEESMMSADEYDRFIENPCDFMTEVVPLRQNRSYAESPVSWVQNYAKAVLATMDQNAAFGAASAFIADKYGYHTTPAGSVGMTMVPFDNLADFNRGFEQASIDIKRRPQKVLDALEAMMPYAISRQKTPVVHILGASQIMTHMGTFLNMRDFEKFYWPTFYKLCHIAGERGQRMNIFCEHDWTRFLDHLDGLPVGTRMFMEYGDPQKFKDKVGHKFVLGGFYPLTLLKSGTKQQCIDKAKELIDIMAPGGNYYFSFDKSALTPADVNIENYIAVLEYALDNSKYENAGQKSCTLSFEDSVEKYSDQYPEFKSKYVLSFDEFIADYDIPDARVEPLMRAAYAKYSAMANTGF